MEYQHCCLALRYPIIKQSVFGTANALEQGLTFDPTMKLCDHAKGGLQCTLKDCGELDVVSI